MRKSSEDASLTTWIVHAYITFHVLGTHQRSQQTILRILKGFFFFFLNKSFNAVVFAQVWGLPQHVLLY